MTGPDDRALVAAVRDHGDERAFTTLYRRHTPALYALALRLTGAVEVDAQEVVHDAWVRAVERLAQFEWRAALRTWLCGIMIRRWRELLRERGRRDVVPLEESPLPVEDQALRGTFDRLELERAVADLPPGYREVFVLHDIEGYTHDEIGALLGIQAGTSKSQLAHARRALRRMLDAPEGA
ncbi:MAG TPA: RNA polymerase sigma factor [Gemmatimonadales bacterium]|nr:RNA polymerase sigma factor [Gemmatimonadales bacterium]